MKQTESIIITGTTLIDGTGSSPVHNANIHIRAGRIESISEGELPDIPQDVVRIDGRDKYVIPGLIDANVHLVAARTPDTLLEFEGRYHELALEAAELALKYGLTTVFDTWGPAQPLVKTRDLINSGEAAGSRVYVAGNIIGLDGPLSADFFKIGNALETGTITRINDVWQEGVGTNLLTMTVDDIGMAVRSYIETSGIDFVKYAGSDHRDEMHFLLFSESAQKRIVEEAHRAGLIVQAHTTHIESLRIEIEAGADLLQHADVTVGRPIPEEMIEEIAAKNLPVAALFVTDDFLAWSEENASGATMSRKLIDINDRALIKAGATILLTTDAFAYGDRIKNHPGFRTGLSTDVPDMPSQIGSGHFLWLKAAFEKGMDPMEILKSATSNIAEAYQVIDEVGTVEQGKVADLLLLDANPLEEAKNYTLISTIIKDGQVVDRDALAKNLLLADDPGVTAIPSR